MGKSNYEKFAKKNQPKVLESTKTLKEAVEYLQNLKGTFSDEYVGRAEMMIQILYGVSNVNEVSEKQQQSKKTFGDAVEVAHDLKIEFSKKDYGKANESGEYEVYHNPIEDVYEIYGAIFGRLDSEVKGAAEGREYWIV